MTGAAAGRGPGASVERAGALVDAGRPRDALEELAAARREHGETAAAARVRALALLALDEPDEAVIAARHAVTIAPLEASGLQILSAALLRTGDSDGAWTAARRAVAAKPDSWRAHIAVADALWLDRGRRVEALRAGYEAIRLAPDEPFVHRHQGDLLLAAGRQRDAQAAYRRGLALSPADRGAQHNLAASRLRGGHDGASAVEFARVLATDPTNAVARRNLVIGVVNPLARARTILGLAAAVTGFEFAVAQTAALPTGFATIVGPVLGSLGVLFVAVRFALETRPRTCFIVRTARTAVPAWTTIAAVLGGSTLVSVGGLFLPSVDGLVAQGLVAVGVVVASVQLAGIRRSLRSRAQPDTTTATSRTERRTTP